MSFRNEGIDHSLSILKELQAKLKLHPDLKTESIQYRPQPTQSSHRRHQTLSSAPSMKPNNQNNYDNAEEIIQENRKLKKYVNSLLQMNDYLKNQLVQKHRQEQEFQKQGPQIQLMRMQIQYLKQLNKDKQLELKKSIYVSNTHRKTHKKSSSFVNKSTKKPTNKKTKCRLCYL